MALCRFRGAHHRTHGLSTKRSCYPGIDRRNLRVVAPSLGERGNMSADNALLRLTGVTRHFGGLKVIEGLGFEVRRGERLGLIGPNGAGKTTTFNLVSG